MGIGKRPSAEESRPFISRIHVSRTPRVVFFLLVGDWSDEASVISLP